jgi:hypothetical protein
MSYIRKENELLTSDLSSPSYFWFATKVILLRVVHHLKTCHNCCHAESSGHVKEAGQCVCVRARGHVCVSFLYMFVVTYMFMYRHNKIDYFLQERGK